MGLGNIILKQGGLLNTPNKQSTTQTPPGHPYGDFVAKYLKCLGVNDLSKVPETLRGVGIKEDAIKCIEDLMRSTFWDEVFMKFNLEAALLEAAARHELQRLLNGGNNQQPGLLPLYGLYNFIVFINAIRQLLGNEDTKSIALTTLAKATYLLFDLYLELTKRKAISPNLEVEFWRVRDVLVNVMEELFKGNRTITVDGKSFDGNKQLR
jgi:hypothetical protein